MGRLTRASCALAAAPYLVLAAVPAAAEPAPVERVYATSAGASAYDGDAHGGNPFATAFIQALDPQVSDAADALFVETLYNSGNLQVADPDAMGPGASLLPREGETAVALVVVFADYGDERGLSSLPGAAFDAARVSAALTDAGFATQMVIARDAAAYRSALSGFAATSAGAERALIYTTGHGGEFERGIFMVPPEAEALPVLTDGALFLDEVAAALRASASNRLIYAGCRDNPEDLRQ